MKKTMLILALAMSSSAFAAVYSGPHGSATGKLEMNQDQAVSEALAILKGNKQEASQALKDVLAEVKESITDVELMKVLVDRSF